MTLYYNQLYKRIQGYAATKPNEIAVRTTDGKTLTWLELVTQADRFGIGLIKSGFKKGDRIFFFVKNSLESIISIFGIMRAGGVLVTADPGMGAENLKSRVKITNPEWTICSSILLSLQSSDALRKYIKSKGLEIPEMMDILGNTKIIRVGNWLPGKPADFKFRDIIQQVIVDYSEVELTDEDFQITFTSGSTDLPKAVVHTHKSISNIAMVISEKLKISKVDKFFTNQFYIIFPALFAGSSIIYNTYLGFNSKKYLIDFNRYQVTGYFDIPKNLLALNYYAIENKITIPASLTDIITGSTPILKAFLAEMRKVLPDSTNLWSVYGMTEMLPVAIIESREKLSFEGEGDLLGKPIDGVKVEFKEDGELLLSGPHMCDRFLNQEKINKIETGDICKIDSESRLILLSRKKDMIIKGHYNIYPTIFENTIDQIPGVIVSSMVGVYDQNRGDENLVLFVVTSSKTSASVFEKYLFTNLTTGKYSIDQYALPDKIILIDKMPIGKRGKIDKEKLRQIAKDQL